MSFKIQILLCGFTLALGTRARADEVFPPLLNLRPYVVYGDVDKRLDLYQVTDPRLLSLADSTVALMNSEHLQLENGDYIYSNQKTLAEEEKLCPGERFAAQRTAAECSGSLIAPDVIITAGHCVPSEAECQQTHFVFGYAVKTNGAVTTHSPASEVYSCKKMLRNVRTGPTPDFALVQLDRPVVGHTPLGMRQSDDIRPTDEVFAIGYPSGLPEKIALGAFVRTVGLSHFVANLDTFAGNSGSPIFNRQTHLLEGVLTSGEDDYIEDKKMGCFRVHFCERDKCKGETVTKINVMHWYPDASIYIH